MCDYTLPFEERFSCFPSEVDGSPVHGLGCPLWQCKTPKDFSPFPEPIKKAIAPPPQDYASAYELTLTTTVDDPYYLRETLNKIVQSAMFEVKRYEACIELTQAGLPHMHAILYSDKKYLDATKIKSPKGPIKYKYRFELKRVRQLANYINYIKKEDGNPIIVDYCTKHGIPQFTYGPPVPAPEQNVQEEKIQA